MAHFSTESITATQGKAICALAMGMPVIQAAKQANCDRATLKRWMLDDPHFQSALSQAKREEIENSRAQVQRLTPLAISKVFEILSAPINSRHVKPSVQLRAALTVLVGADGMAEVDRRVMLENVVAQSTNSARALLVSKITELTSREIPAGNSVELNGVAG